MEISERKETADGQSRACCLLQLAEFSPRPPTPFIFFLPRRQVPNFEVRANAALLFTEAFPVHDPSHSSQAVEAAIQKQLDTAMVGNKPS